MLLLISHNANLHVACGYIGFWVCRINHHVCCMDTHMCVYGFVSDTSVYACIHGCQEWGAELSLHVNWSMLFAIYLCLSGSGIRWVCFFFKCEGWHIDWSRLCDCKPCTKFTHPDTCMHVSVYVYVACNLGSSDASINRCNKQSTDGTSNQSIKQSSNQQMESINQTHPNNQAINRCINQSSNQAINLWCCMCVCVCACACGMFLLNVLCACACASK